MTMLKSPFLVVILAIVLSFIALFAFLVSCKQQGNDESDDDDVGGSDDDSGADDSGEDDDADGDDSHNFFDDDEGDDDGDDDAAGNGCEGYTGSSYCCQDSDPCGWAANEICDCEGTCDWDVPDCGMSDDDEITDPCGGYSGDDFCCQEQNPCGMNGNGTCDCDGFCYWDFEDCGADDDGWWDDDIWWDDDWWDDDIWGDDDEVCPGYTGWSFCCVVTDPCDYANDGFCDCDGACDWDTTDCGSRSGEDVINWTPVKGH